jgi:hypothetical protein
MVSFTPRPLYPQRKSPWYPLDRKLGGPQSRFGRGGEEKNYKYKYIYYKNTGHCLKEIASITVPVTFSETMDIFQQETQLNYEIQRCNI